nr:hypothetical protein [uncultured Sphaerochaeta sp.]
MDSQFFLWLADNQPVASILTQLFSALAVIIASVVAVLISGRKDRLEAKKTAEYFSSLIRFIWLDLRVLQVDLEKHKENKELFLKKLIVIRLSSLKRCQSNVDAIQNNLLHFAQYSRATSIEEIHGFLAGFDVFSTLIENADLTKIDKIWPDIEIVLNKITDQIFEVMKIEYHMDDWYSRKILKTEERFKILTFDSTSMDTLK